MTSPTGGPRSLVGRVFAGRFEVLSPIARGGMAEVFRGRDNLLGRPVALKVLHPEFAVDQSFVERFRREAQAAANLNHPHIVSVYDWGSEDGTYFMVLEYVEGRTLRDILRTDGRMSVRRTVEVGAETASALHFAHRHGVIHRDVKAGNILITTSGETKVTDFGIARAANTTEGLTQTGAVIGTAGYFSPEQAQGFAVDARSDVYSLGVVLYEMLSGRQPFEGDSPVAVAYKHVREAPVPLRQMVPDVPAPLEAVVHKCLAKVPDNRYQSAEELRQDLARFAQGQPVMAARTPAPTAVAAPVPMAATQAVPRVASAPPTRVQEEAAPVYRDPPSRWPLVTLIVVLIVGIAVALLFLLRSFREEEAVKVSVPDIIGSIYEPGGRQAMERAGLIPLATVVPHDSIGQGVVISTEPPPTTSIDRDATVRVLISGGRETVKVPSVVGQPQAEAEKALTAAGFALGQVTPKADDQAEKGRVLSQDPPAGADAAKGAKVNLVVSGGKEKVKVPPVEGQEAFRAAQQLNQLGLQADRTEEFSSTVQEEIVIRSDPPPGTEVDKGTKVLLVVSKGRESVKVPDVVGSDVDSATAALEEAGFVVDVTPDPPPTGGRVTAQEPRAGSDAKKGDTVRITVGPPATTTTTTTTTSSTTTTSTTAPTSSSSTSTTR